ncbi:MAG: DUF1987 family protein [Crocinitomicaceae bacterium]|nr:DUF1987 family protein [Crocinitomicaceae bacterium]
MELYRLESTRQTPHIYGSIEEGVIQIKGICRPDNSIEFFQDFISWINLFNTLTAKNIVVEIDLEYMNTSSGMIIYRILNSIKSKLNPDQELSIIWKHDRQDFDMKQVGEDFQYMLGDIFTVQPA